ncbi:heat shock 70 kDa protein 12A-like [Mytilus edulis]|uniref:heat shock 70 kDa protein 12A-like n=1 Tax=Mytilus edulis TaxID=6550 RepID=UPI0039EFCA0D
MSKSLKTPGSKSIEKNDFKLVAAIDFGTTFSGYAFSSKDDYKSNPLLVYAMVWPNEVYQSSKTSTTILLDADKKFHSFGFEAETDYANLAQDDKHRDWYYFRRFKMVLFENMNIDMDMMLKDETGKEMLALDVFSAAISYLKTNLLDMCKRQHYLYNGDQIRWILTVPALWNDRAKLFMRQAANQAGISQGQLVVALEPEAASLYCIEWMKRETSFDLEKGEKVLVLDAGGGTVDIAIHQIKENGRIQELHRANGGDWGGTKVDQEFKQLLIDIVGNQVYEELKSKHHNDYMDLFRVFEVAKRKDFSVAATGKVPIRLPSIVNELCKQINKKDINEIVSTNNTFINHIQLSRDKLLIDISIFKKLFEKTINEIKRHLQELYQKKDINDIRTIFMVGGFSYCHLLYDCIQKEFPSVRVKVPMEPAIAVIKGSVIYGHKPEIFSSRISVYTYGIETTEPFDRKEHPASKKMTEAIDGKYHCDKIFCIHVKEGETITLGSSVRKTYKTIDPNQMGMDFKVYATKKKSPKFTDEPGCFYVGKLKVDLSGIAPGKNKTREIEVELIYGGTELDAVARDTKAGREFRGHFVLGSRTRKVSHKKE